MTENRNRQNIKTIDGFAEDISLSSFFTLLDNENDKSISAFEKQKHTTRKITKMNNDKYSELQEIGRGGMGRVVLWKDNNLQRVVATKLLHNKNISDEVLQRFFEEGQIAGQLEHPNIVPIHDVGVNKQGNLYITMKYVKGESLEDTLTKVKENPQDWSMGKILQIFLSMCYAIEYAHSKKVIHRDLKPENIMIGKFGETMVMDWGIAKVIGQGQDLIKEESISTLRSEGGFLTMTGKIVGTPQYMSPEQAKGDIKELDHFSDIYSLGLILHEMVTGERAIDAKNIIMAVLKASKAQLEPLPTLGLFGKIPKELIAIIRKSTELEKEKRYHSARELAEDIQNFLDNKEVKACNYKLVDKAKRVCRKNRKEILLVVSTVFIVASCFIGWYSWNKRRITAVLVENAHHLLQESRTKSSAKQQKENVLKSIDGYRQAYETMKCPLCKDHLHEYQVYEAQAWAEFFHQSEKVNDVSSMKLAQKQMKHLLRLEDHHGYEDILEKKFK